ncbi:hypothetical protein ACR9VJ_26415 [Streptomyces sp. H49]|uniref:hypothetical protein n=1 Tax=Streptomyces sp. H49 TaxID=3444117 RepID=UPI003F4ABC4D
MSAADQRRHVTGLLLAHAEPSLHRGVLQLRFRNPAIARAWRESEAQVALEGALAANRIQIPVHVVEVGTAIA